MELIDTRKVQFVGNALMLSLPKSFIDSEGIKKGDIMNVYRDGKNLILNKGKEEIKPNGKIEGEEDAKE